MLPPVDCFLRWQLLTVAAGVRPVNWVMTPAAFIAKWAQVTTTERAAAQSHFLDLCELLNVEKPLDADPTGAFYAFERRVNKILGGKGFADVWKRGHFAWEYKRKNRDLQAAYTQLLLYREDLENPPLLIVCDLHRFEIHTNFTGTPKRIYAFTLSELNQPETLDLLRAAFTDPNALNPKRYRERVTQEASRQIGALSLRLHTRGHEPQTVAHFMMQLVFALFAEDVRLLPDKLVTRILEKTYTQPGRAQRFLSDLFTAMAHGGDVGLDEVPHFNGGLFDNRGALPLEQTELKILLDAAKLDWAEVEPVIFGTLFERSLDPGKRSQLGAHYTSREDILRIVQPVVIDPLRAEWSAVRREVETYLEDNPLPDERTLDRKRLAAFNAVKRKRDERTLRPISSFLERLRHLKVLDPACGSGNFLYVAFQQLKELERDVLTFAGSIGLPLAPFVSPRQFYGLEVNVFAHELASIVVWIGYLQWNFLNHTSDTQRPILERLGNIKLQDALLDGDKETAWPEADFIVGNPPFLGNYKMRQELGDSYVQKLYDLFRGRVPNGADFVCYWFEKARAQIAEGKTARAGLITTNSVRQPKNNPVLNRIKATGELFTAWSDEPWVLEGAAVRVSMVAFDDGSQEVKRLNGELVTTINADLTGGADISSAKFLAENLNKCFKGVEPAGAFDITAETAQVWVTQLNPNGKSNLEVLKRYVGAKDIVQKDSERWLIDFRQMSQAEAEDYLVPFAHVIENVKPERGNNREPVRRDFWWRHGRSRPELRAALEALERYIATPRVSKHRVYVWLTKNDLPSGALSVIATDKDFFYGVLNSSIHVLWSNARGSSLEDRPQYTNEVFETFPFPRPAVKEHADTEKWAKYLDTVRSRLLAADEKRTMTKLYNDLTVLRETRDSSSPVYALLVAHDKLDAAVAAAYGWDWPLPDETILERLLALNLARAAEENAQPLTVGTR